MRAVFCLHLAPFGGPETTPLGGLLWFPQLHGPRPGRLVGTELVPGWVGLVAGALGQQSLEHVPLNGLHMLGLWLCPSQVLNGGEGSPDRQSRLGAPPVS